MEEVEAKITGMSSPPTPGHLGAQVRGEPQSRTEAGLGQQRALVEETRHLGNLSLRGELCAVWCEGTSNRSWLLLAPLPEVPWEIAILVLL